jgi:hypothetical protein
MSGGFPFLVYGCDGQTVVTVYRDCLVGASREEFGDMFGEG